MSSFSVGQLVDKVAPPVDHTSAGSRPSERDNNKSYASRSKQNVDGYRAMRQPSKEVNARPARPSETSANNGVPFKLQTTSRAFKAHAPTSDGTGSVGIGGSAAVPRSAPAINPNLPMISSQQGSFPFADDRRMNYNTVQARSTLSELVPQMQEDDQDSYMELEHDIPPVNFDDAPQDTRSFFDDDGDVFRNEEIPRHSERNGKVPKSSKRTSVNNTPRQDKQAQRTQKPVSSQRKATVAQAADYRNERSASLSANKNRLATGSASSLASGQGTSASPRPEQSALQSRDANALPMTGVIGEQTLKMPLLNPSQQMKKSQHLPSASAQNGICNGTVIAQHAEEDELYDEELFQEMDREARERSNMEDVTMDERRGHVGESLRRKEQAYNEQQAYNEPDVKDEGEDEEGDVSDDGIEDAEDQDLIARGQATYHQRLSAYSQGRAGRSGEGLRRNETSQTPEPENQEHSEAEYDQDDIGRNIDRDARNLDENGQASEKAHHGAVQQTPAPTLAVHQTAQEASQRAQQAYQLSQEAEELSRGADEVANETYKLSWEADNLLDEADELSQQGNELEDREDAIQKAYREALVARQRARDARRQAQEAHQRAQEAHQRAQAAHQGAARNSLGQAMLGHQQAEKTHQQAQSIHRGSRKEHQQSVQYYQRCLEDQQVHLNALMQVGTLANDQPSEHDELQLPDAEASHEIARDDVMQVEVPQVDLERRPGCLCQECFLPPVNERDDYHTQTLEEWYEEGKGYLNEMPKLLNAMLEAMKSRVEACNTLSDKPEIHKQGVMAKQAENEAQRAKIRAWKNGTFGKMSQKIVTDTPPASQ